MVPIDVRARAFGDLSQLALTGGIHVESERTALADVAERWKRQATSHTASCSSHLEVDLGSAGGGGPRSCNSGAMPSESARVTTTVRFSYA
ncbi:hypothetical protein GCM10020255_008380 [Rhodococcus baikonurensis]